MFDQMMLLRSLDHFRGELEMLWSVAGPESIDYETVLRNLISEFNDIEQLIEKGVGFKDA